MPQSRGFASLFEALQFDERARRRLRRGQTVEGTVVQVGPESIFVDVGATIEARVARSELEDREGQLLVAPGDRVRGTVVEARDDALVLRVRIGPDDHVDLGTLEAASRSGVPVWGQVRRAVKGGLEVDLGGVLAFCPASQIDRSHVPDLAAFEGQRLEFRVLEVRGGERSVVISRRVLLEEQHEQEKRQLLERLLPGAELEGRVHSVERHGLVVDLGGIEGFVHLSELGAGRPERATDIARPGDTVRVRVLEVEESRKGLRVRLTMKGLSQPLREVGRVPSAPEVLTGVITRVLAQGVMVQTSKGEGLVAPGELGLAPGMDHRRVFAPGQEVDVVVLDHDARTGRMRMSMARVAEVVERQSYAAYAEAARKSPGSTSLGSLGDLFQAKLSELSGSVQGGREQAPARTTACARTAEVSVVMDCAPADKGGSKRTESGPERTSEVARVGADVGTACRAAQATEAHQRPGGGQNAKGTDRPRSKPRRRVVR